MRNATLEKIIWVLIYGGLLSASLGAFVRRNGAAWGGALVAAGAVAAVIGVVLIWLRSRRQADPPR